MLVLLVEDQLDVLDCMRLYLGERGHEVHTAATAQEALAWLNCATPDLAVVDMLLPRGHGRQVVQEIASRAARARNDGREVRPTRVVVVTACDDLNLRREMLSLGVTDYLFKPITVRELDALFAEAAPLEKPEEQP